MLSTINRKIFTCKLSAALKYSIYIFFRCVSVVIIIDFDFSVTNEILLDDVSFLQIALLLLSNFMIVFNIICLSTQNNGNFEGSLRKLANTDGCCRQPHGDFTPHHAYSEPRNAVKRSTREYHYVQIVQLAP